MTTPSLTIGSIFLAFSPTLSLLFLLVFQKPQLVILAVCSAFAYLLSALLSSLIWLITSAVGRVATKSNDGENDTNGIGTLLALAVPGVLCQMVVRCLFVRGYFKVEAVIRRSVAKHEEEVLAAANATSNANSNGNADSHAETNALQLQLNDLSCSIASGCGWALLHSLLLYGTLLASESGEASRGGYDESGAYAGGGGSTGHGGTLYQDSCGGMPSLINGALIACMFSVLDVIWMMLCFFGMRRRSLQGSVAEMASVSRALLRGLSFRGLDDSPAGGNVALITVALTHLAASLALAPNAGTDGCMVSLPCLGAVTVFAALFLGRATSQTKLGFLPEDQRRRIQGIQLGLRTGDGSHHVE